MNTAMPRITPDAEAGQVSAEFARRSIAARVHVLVELVGEDAGMLSMTATAQEGGASDWLGFEPDLYTDAEMVQPPSTYHGQLGYSLAMLPLDILKCLPAPVSGVKGAKTPECQNLSGGNDGQAPKASAISSDILQQKRCCRRSARVHLRGSDKCRCARGISRSR